MDHGSKGLVWRRAVAAGVDLVLFVVVASLASVALYLATNGLVRAPTFRPITQCEQLAEISAEVAQAAQRALPGGGARPTSAVLCRRVFLGFESGRYVAVTLAAQQGEMTVAARVFLPVDRSGRPIKPITFDWLYPLVLILALSGLEAAIGTTPGKNGLGLAVTGADGRRAGFPRLLARNAILYLWALAALTWPIAMRALGPELVEAGAGAQILRAIGYAPGAILALAVASMLALSAVAPAYDRWTGVRVVRAP